MIFKWILVFIRPYQLTSSPATFRAVLDDKQSVTKEKYANFDVTKPEEEVGLIGTKFYVDEVYDVVFVKTLKKLSTFIDKVLDDKIIDGFIMNSSIGFVNIGKKVAMLQNANVRFYAAFMLIGMTSIFIYIYITLGL